MEPPRSSAWRELEVQGSLIYLFLVLSVFIVAFAMLMLANVRGQGLITPSVLIATSLTCSLQTYRRKKAGRPAAGYSWAAASIFVMIPIAQKFIYVSNYGWEVALSSYNSSVQIIIAVVINQFLYDTRLFKVLAVAALAGWLAFLVAAVLSGTPMSIQSVEHGRGVSGFVVLREVFIMLVSIIVWFAVYRIIPLTENYDRTTTEQRRIIESNNTLLEAQVHERTQELVTINNALRERNVQIESELDMARLILNKLMPEALANIEGLDYFALNVSMDKVGGDFYGFKHAGGPLEILLADASGHGLHAAFLSLITKMTYDSIETQGSPSGTLGELNRAVCRSSVRGNFVTAVCCVVDVANRCVRISSAGHWPVIVFNRDSGVLSELGVHGIPLGWIPEYRFAAVERQLSPGDRVIAFTDGIIECGNARGELFGMERLGDFIRGHAGSTPRELSESLLSHLHEYTETAAFNDDLSIIVCDVIR
ncbi:MAG TPA: PP2C family protein-serine/threonine phosphatase [Spirochaetota bacterium]|nr:PP2C family protein-serine/threonine phosphatase [Spirochaetota bacterium]HNT12318.1 PP2C family protein-serine/threonine phosphatase [Spirochaetota bacterium]HNV46788.1 PP2C family protein-serine/threonine phosphatase [Spirochaetota bacterium]HPU89238.1 PP2C family protein-serine/threonine phosphatase [Spirochaetota bacterium]